MEVVREIVRRSLRDDDTLGLIGDHLVVVLANTNAEEARAIGDRLCGVVRTHTFANGQSQVTLSIGTAAAPEHSTTYEGVSARRTRRAGQDPDAGARRCGGRAAAASRRAPPAAGDRPTRRPRRGDGVAEQMARRGVRGTAALVSVFGETGTGTATLLRQLESEVRLRGGMFAMASSPNLSIGKPYGVWRALLRVDAPIFRRLRSVSGTSCSTSSRRSAMHEHGEHTGSQYRLLGELADYVRSLAAEPAARHRARRDAVGRPDVVGRARASARPSSTRIG